LFYDNYLRLCNSVGKSPSAVALEIGIEKSTVTRWKQGKSQTDANIRKVADYFGVPVSELTGEKEKAPTQEGEREIENPDIRMIARAGQKMTPDQAKNLRKYAEFMFPEAFKDDDT
jgi:transcriptional regulator with XRE-family HTH domain